MIKARKYTPDEDAPLLASWQHGEIISFESLVWKYLKRLYNLSYLLVGDPESASEAVQSAFITAYREIGSLRSTSRFSTWLAGLAIKESRTLLDLKEISSRTNTAVEVPGNETNLESNLRSPFQGDPRVYITALPPELREVVVLRYVRGYSLERMEEILQIRVEILTTRLFEAQEMLAAQMKHGAGAFRMDIQSKREDALPHPEIRRTLPVYLDNAADEEEKDHIRKHLGGCGSCREALAELEWMVEYLRCIPDVEPPHGLTAAIMTKIRTVGPSEPVRPSRSFSSDLLPLLLGVGVLTLLSITWYFIGWKTVVKTVDSSPVEKAKSSSLVPAPEGKAGQQPLPSLPLGAMSIRISGKGAERPAGTVLPESPATQPKTFSPSSDKEVIPSLPPKPAGSVVSRKPETAVKKARAEVTSQLPQEWGEILPSSRTIPRKTAIHKSRSGEVEVVLGTEDPVGSVREIEQAVTGLGGKITGRAYSSGKDILYTQIETDKFFELMKRLGKIGKLLELPQLPEEATGNIDLVIRW